MRSVCHWSSARCQWFGFRWRSRALGLVAWSQRQSMVGWASLFGILMLAAPGAKPFARFSSSATTTKPAPLTLFLPPCCWTSNPHSFDSDVHHGLYLHLRQSFRRRLFLTAGIVASRFATLASSRAQSSLRRLAFHITPHHRDNSLAPTTSPPQQFSTPKIFDSA